MTVQSKAWERVGENFETLGTHLRGHLDEVSSQTSAERAAFEKSVRGVLSALEDGFAAAREAVRDPALRRDVGEVAASVREAMLASFETAGEQVRKRLTASGSAPPSAKPATTATAPKPVARRAPARKRSTS